MKTIFITVTRGLVVRNILRTKVFEKLRQRNNLRIVVLIQNIFNIAPPDYLEKELGGENVVFEFVPNIAARPLQKRFNSLIRNLVFTKTSKYYITERPEAHKRKSGRHFFFIKLMYRPLSKFIFLKKLARKAALLIHRNSLIASYFNKYSPDLVFSTAIQSSMDYEILKEAKKRKIKTVSMPKSWDNIDRVLYNVEPDIFLVQNSILKDQVARYQAIDPRTIQVIGFPQFDIYKENIFISKEAYCARTGLDPGLPILFLGSEGKWTIGDDKIFEEIILSREKGDIKPCNIIIRPHFSTAQTNPYGRFSQYGNVFIDNRFRKSDFFGDGWDPTADDQIDFANLLCHCSALVTFASTLALDAACFNKPIIAVAYGVNFLENNADVTRKLYESGHYEQVMMTGAPILADSREKLISNINLLLENPHLRQKEVGLLKENMCGRLDGSAGERTAEIIFDYLYAKDTI